jgi:hypothetical protein
VVLVSVDSVERESILARRERRLRQVAVFGLVAIAVTVAAGIVLQLPQGVFVTTAGALGLGILAARLFLWRCPSCGSPLPGRSGSRDCPGCDRPLVEGRSSDDELR